MADLADLIQKLSFYQAGGKDPGTDTLDKINTSSDIIGNAINNVLAIKKANLDRQKIQGETTKLKNENTPYVEQYGTPSIKAGIAQAEAAPIPTEDLISGKLDTRQQAINSEHQRALDLQKKYGNLTTGQVATNAAAGLKEAQLNAMNKEAKSIWVNPEDPNHPVSDINSVDPAIRSKYVEFGRKEATAPLIHGMETGTSEQMAPETVDLLAKRALGGMVDPMGLGSKVRVPVFNRMAEIAKESGDTVGSQAMRQAALKASQQELQTVQKNRGVVGSFIGTLDKQLNILSDYSQSVGKDALNTGIPVLQRWINAGKKKIAGDVDVNNLDTIINTVNSEYARAMNTITGGGAVADEAVKRNQDNLTSATTPQQIQGWIKTIRAEAANRSSGYADEIGRISHDISNTASNVGTQPQVQPQVQPQEQPNPASPVLKKSGGGVGLNKEVERLTSDGKTAIFDANTKKFLRYK